MKRQISPNTSSTDDTELSDTCSFTDGYRTKLIEVIFYHFFIVLLRKHILCQRLFCGFQRYDFKQTTTTGPMIENDSCSDESNLPGTSSMTYADKREKKDNMTEKCRGKEEDNKRKTSEFIHSN